METLYFKKYVKSLKENFNRLQIFIHFFFHRQSGGDEKNVQNAFPEVNSAKRMKKSISTGGNAVFEKKLAFRRYSLGNFAHDRQFAF